jgi:hypothetical protein
MNGFDRRLKQHTVLLLVKFRTKIVHDYQNTAIFSQQLSNKNQQKMFLMYFSLECFKTQDT